MKKLDRKDYLLLDALGEGSRKSPAKIAKELKMHKNSVLYRIKRLKKMKILQRFSLIPGFAAMGKNTFYVFFRLRVSDNEKEKVYSYLKTHPLAMEVLRLSGKWNIMMELVCDDMLHFNEELAGISDHLGNRLSDYRTFLLYTPYKVEASINFEKEYMEEPFKPPKPAARLDALDKRLLGLLSDNSDLSYNELAEKADTTADTAFYRVRKLIDEKVIMKFVPVIDLEKIGFQNYIILLKLSDVSEEKFDSLRGYLVNNRSINFSFRTAGELGVVIFCAYKTNWNLDDFLTNLVSSFGDVVREQEVLIISETLKFDYFPKGLRA